MPTYTTYIFPLPLPSPRLAASHPSSSTYTLHTHSTCTTLPEFHPRIHASIHASTLPRTVPSRRSPFPQTPPTSAAHSAHLRPRPQHSGPSSIPQPVRRSIAAHPAAVCLHRAAAAQHQRARLHSSVVATDRAPTLRPCVCARTRRLVVAATAPSRQRRSRLRAPLFRALVAARAAPLVALPPPSPSSTPSTRTRCPRLRALQRLVKHHRSDFSFSFSFLSSLSISLSRARSRVFGLHQQRCSCSLAVLSQPFAAPRPACALPGVGPFSAQSFGRRPSDTPSTPLGRQPHARLGLPCCCCTRRQPGVDFALASPTISRHVAVAVTVAIASSPRAAGRACRGPSGHVLGAAKPRRQCDHQSCRSELSE